MKVKDLTKALKSANPEGIVVLPDTAKSSKVLRTMRRTLTTLRKLPDTCKAKTQFIKRWQKNIARFDAMSKCIIIQKS